MSISFKDRTLLFFKQFEELYPDYEIVYFKNLSTPLIFKDKEGNEFKRMPGRVFKHKTNCYSIVDKYKYIQGKIHTIFPNLTLINYKGMKSKLLVQDNNGFQYEPQCYDLLQGHPVSIVSCTKPYDLFCFKANKKHNNKYSYPVFDYTNSKKKIDVFCEKHGIFNSLIESHLLGRGCPICKKDNSSFSRTHWIEKSKNKQCIFYMLEFFNETERFIKIGITRVNIKKRYHGVKNYKYNILLEYESNSTEISNIEQYYLKGFKTLKYKPISKFEGHTECFNLELKNIIYDKFKK
ncbi:MAG: hypothetical protein WCP46_00190 [Alphaproteobacteria bacterium]